MKIKKASYLHGLVLCSIAMFGLSALQAEDQVARDKRKQEERLRKKAFKHPKARYGTTAKLPSPKPMTAEEKENLIVYTVTNGIHYHNAMCYSMQSAFKNKEYRSVKLGVAHDTHAPCPDCPYIPKLSRERNVDAALHKNDPYHLTKKVESDDDLFIPRKTPVTTKAHDEMVAKKRAALEEAAQGKNAKSSSKDIIDK